VGKGLLGVDSELGCDSVLLDAVSEMAGGLNALYQQTAELLQPEVDYIIQQGITNPQSVEGLLDQLLDCAACNEGLFQFKRLLRHYYPIDPECVKFYVDVYRAMYEAPSFPEIPARHKNTRTGTYPYLK